MARHMRVAARQCILRPGVPPISRTSLILAGVVS
jgi:hypothetical protein